MTGTVFILLVVFIALAVAARAILEENRRFKAQVRRLEDERHRK